MLAELRISDFAIIDRLELQLEPGFVAFTGETGAGKSIIIDAVEALMGGRVDTTMIRAQEDRALIEGEFRIAESVRARVCELLEGEDLLDSDTFVTLAREIRSQGRHVARINGRSVTVGLLKQLGEQLVDVHGQSDHLSLLRTKEHLRLLDSYAGLDDQVSAYRETYSRLRKVESEISALKESERDAARRADLLEYQIDEIEMAKLSPGEEGALRQERNRLANAESLVRLSQEALDALDESSLEKPSASDLIGEALTVLSRAAQADPTRRETAERLEEISLVMGDLAMDLRDYIDSIEFNTRRLAEVEERLDLILRLKRKYGDSIAEVLAFASQAQEELESISRTEERKSDLQEEAADLRERVAGLGEQLSALRREAAEDLSAAVEQQLVHLRLDGAQLEVEFQPHLDPEGIELSNGERVSIGPQGFESIQFLVAPNPGEGLRPLSKIASGGELSRLMLAIKHVLVQADLTPTLIFDEIDQGIGGRVGAVVGRKLSELALRHQVLCITHLPQLAAYGSQHYRVTKQLDGGRTITVVQNLEGDSRLNELALMLGDLSPATLESARDMLDGVGVKGE